jgi:hypothetical protein
MPRYYLCDGNGNCNPPSFFCNGFGNACAASKDVACCGDPSNGYTLACVTLATCASQTSGNFEMSCGATMDCPSGTFCCAFYNPDLYITGCSANCQTFALQGFDPTSYVHRQACDTFRDTSCPAGQHCQTDPGIGLDACGP